ncbi:unnamed protein product [Nesidiocoris tenuis]|uniref:Uncharacterized protein n=1 Tax=Nesidiocoris tenuis TaxID=355587 RepID=A0A6H5H845_9HEMI|nr:unnamed protein product [Nesidiocoris tenuis]
MYPAKRASTSTNGSSKSHQKLRLLPKSSCACDFAKFCRLPPELDVGTQQYQHRQFGQPKEDSLRWRYRNRDEIVHNPDNETLRDKIKIVNLLLDEIEHLTGIPTQIYLDNHSDRLKQNIDEIINDIMTQEKKRKRISEDERGFHVF